MKYRNLVFYCPSRNAGGNEYLFIRLSEHLTSNKYPYRIYYIDYLDGFARQYLQNLDVHFIDYDGDNASVIPEDSVVITQLNMISQLDKFKYNRSNTEFLFWCLHNKNIKNQIYIKGHYFIGRNSRKRLGEEIKYLTSTYHIRFMSQMGYDNVIEDFQLKHDLQIESLPNIVPVDKMQKPDISGRPNGNKWFFCWLGRLDVELSRNLLSYMNDLEVVATKKEVTLFVIGKGHEESMLKQRAKGYSYSIEFLGEKRERELDYVIDNSDVGLAIGTSALEFAMRGKPVIMSWSQAKEYGKGERGDYTFLYHSERFKDIETFGSVFSEIIDELDRNYVDVCRESYEFVLQKSPEACAKKLINNVEYFETHYNNETWRRIDKVSTLINRGVNRISFLSKIKHLFDKH